MWRLSKRGLISLLAVLVLSAEFLIAAGAQQAAPLNLEAMKIEMRKRYGSDFVDRLLNGSRDDLVVLTPRILAANAKEAVFCVLGGGQPTSELLEYAKARFASGDPLEFRKAECPISGPLNVDVVIVERGRLLTEPLGSALLDALNSKSIALYDIVDSAAAALRRQRLRQDAGQLPTLRDGKLTGFGMLIVANSSRRICASKSDDAVTLRQELDRMRQSVKDSAIAAALQQDVDLLFIEDLYIKAKGNGCRYVVGRHQTLRTLLNALADDPVQVSLGPVWLPERDLAGSPARQ